MSGLPIIIALLVGVAVYVIGILLIPKNLISESTSFTRKQLKHLEQDVALDEEYDIDLNRDRYQINGALSKIFYSLPFSGNVHPYLVRAGMASQVDNFVLACLGILVCSLIVIPFAGISHNVVMVLLLALLVTFACGWLIIRGMIKSRMNKFINQFPDALDIIVRSVKSGFPLNAAVNMVAESMPAPASEEFRQMSSEVVHGSTLVDALSRMGKRMQTPDINFFVVVLTLQQEVGGNLAEVLSNLSALIRKRKMMVKKIHAITAEGRFTGWVLGSLPLLVALAIHVLNPKYLLPLFTTPSGHMTLAATVITIAIGVGIIRKMVDMEI
jgi:tight adherence protein B